MIESIHTRTCKGLYAAVNAEQTTYSKYRFVCGYSVRKLVEHVFNEKIDSKLKEKLVDIIYQLFVQYNGKIFVTNQMTDLFISISTFFVA